MEIPAKSSRSDCRSGVAQENMIIRGASKSRIVQAMQSVVTVGFKVVGMNITRFPPPYSISRHLREFLRDHSINLVLDVGAFRGEYCRMLRFEAGYTGRIVSFEPCANSFRDLASKMRKDPEWRGYSWGLSDSDLKTVLNTFGQNGSLNSVLRLREQPGRIYGVDASRSVMETIQLHKLDTIWDEITEGIAVPRAFLKTDTQGHDVAVVRGAVGHLACIEGIQSELPVVEIYDGMTPMVEALKIYEGLGYVPVGFYSLNRPSAYCGVSPEFDVIFQRACQ